MTAHFLKLVYVLMVLAVVLLLLKHLMKRMCHQERNRRLVVKRTKIVTKAKVKASRVDSMVMKMEVREVVGEAREVVHERGEEGEGVEEGIKETRQVKNKEIRVARVAKPPTRGEKIRIRKNLV